MNQKSTVVVSRKIIIVSTGQELTETWKVYFLINDMEELDRHFKKKIKLFPNFTSYKRLHSKWIRELNVKTKTTSVLKHNVLEFL